MLLLRCIQIQPDTSQPPNQSEPLAPVASSMPASQRGGRNKAPTYREAPQIDRSLFKDRYAQQISDCWVLVNLVQSHEDD